MRRFEFAPGAASVSLLGFGCASVMGRVGRRQSLDAMACAFELGVTHFDIARSYGFGDAEAVLGHFLRGRRDRVTVTSKFGVAPPQLAPWQRLARPVVRPLRKMLAPLRRQIQQQSGALLANHRYDVDYARECLQTSLRALGTDCIDFYLLHEPSAAALPDIAAVREFLQGRVQAGQIRAWGVAHAEGVLDLPAPPHGSVLQYASSLGSTDAMPPTAGNFDLRFITRPLGGGDPEGRMSEGLRQIGGKLGLAPRDLAFHWACHEVGAAGSVIAGMYTRAHVAANVRAVEAYCARAAEFAQAAAAHRP